MKNCGNCVYKDISINEEPCIECMYCSHWEAEENTEDLKEDKISSKQFIKGFGG